MGNLWFELTGEYYKSVKKLESTERAIKGAIKERLYAATGLI
jgi:hypothetical protein